MKHIILKPVLSAITFLMTTLTAHTAFAAPGTLADSPLFVSNAVEPNVFFTIDDSGSMFWEHMYPDGVAGFDSKGGRPHIGAYYRQYWHPDWFTDKYVIPPATYQHSDPAVTWDDDMWVMRNHNANKLYYNPNTTYTPWKGIDSSGNPLYSDADPKAVLKDPNSPGGTKTDLTDTFDYWDYDDCNCWMVNSLYIPSYFTWTDTNGNGQIDATDGHTLYEIKSTTPSYPSGRNYTDELQNFANWFQYYRKREFSAKAAIGAVINNSDATRMGLDLFNHGHQEDVTTMTTPANKRNLLNTFYNYPSSGGTPARNSLKRVGNYFASTSGTPPILDVKDGGECQQNFNILMTDGFWNGGDPGVGNADASATADGGFDGDASESNDGGNYEDNKSNTLADVAMHFYETDLRGDLDNKVPVNPGVDENPQQHLVTYTISFGLTGTLDSSTVSPLDAGFTWPNAYNGDLEKVDDLWHAAYNGRGQYLSAQNPAELESALAASIDDIADRTATAAAASVTSAALTTQSIVYLSEFNTNRWQGNVYAYGIANLSGGASLNTTPTWDAASKLDARLAANRRMFTYDKTTAKDGVAFQWSSISSAMQDDLKTSANGSTDPDPVGQARLDYLRGDRSNENAGLSFRNRATLLGDIIHSGPVYVADPSLRWPDKAPFPTGASAYSNFKSAYKNRNGIIYVGANDSMIHAFDGQTGEELLAYIPSYLSSTNAGAGLHYLTQSNYQHRYYNDLTPTVSDVYINADGSTGWKTILVSGQRGGGRGYSALNITDPSLFNSESNASKISLWEFSSDDDPDLGYTFSRPQIGMTNDNEWVVIFGNGYNDTGDGKAKLFIVKIEAGADGSWNVSDYTKISTGVGSTTNRNGLATPALVDVDGDGTIDRAYAGDLRGNLWTFDLSATSPASWSTAFGAGVPLFTTIGNRPITSQPAVSRHPTITTDGTNLPNIMVTFGTGQYMVSSDKNSTNSNYFYGVWDKGSANKTSSDLVQQTFRSGFSGKRVLTQNSVDYTAKFGWYIPLPDSGERVVSNPIIRSNVVFFNSTVPTADACSVGGYGYRFAVDLATGGTPTEPVIDINNDGKIDDDDTTGTLKDVESAKKFNRLLTDDTMTQNFIVNDKEILGLKTAPTRQTGRISWQELLK